MSGKNDNDRKIIYSMMGVGKVRGTKKVLEDISLSYFYGAKIGVIGLNGAGKSTLLRILAGEDTEILGETAISPGYTVGMLHQEPELDDEKTVLEVVKEGVSETVELLEEFEEINQRFAEPMSDDEMSEWIRTATLAFWDAHLKDSPDGKGQLAPERWRRASGGQVEVQHR